MAGLVQAQKSKIVLFLFVLALISGFFWNQKIFGYKLTSDQRFYDGVAMDILQKGAFTFGGEGTYLEPAYPLFLAGIYKVFGRVFDSVRIIQIFIFALTIVFVYLLALEIFSSRIAFLSGAITASFYGLATMAGLLLAETFFIFLIVFLLYSLYKASFFDSNIWLAVSGAVLGLATLTKGIIQLFFIFVIFGLVVIYSRGFGYGHAMRKSAIFLAVFLMVLTPWFLKNYPTNIQGAIVPRAGEQLLTRAEWMENLYLHYPAHFIGHLLGYYFAQKFDPNVSSSVFRETPYTESRFNELIKSGKNYYEIDEIVTSEAKLKILKAPHKYILMSILDFISFNSPIIPRGDKWQNTLAIHPLFADGRYPGASGLLKTVVILILRFFWFLFFFLVFYGVMQNIRSPHRDNWKSWQKFGWLLLIIIYFNFAYSALHAIPRYALPIYPFYVTLAVVGVATFFNSKWLSFRN